MSKSQDKEGGNYYAKKSVSKNGVCLFDRFGDGSWVCVLQSVCVKRQYSDAGDRCEFGDPGHKRTGRRLYVRQDDADLGGGSR